MGFRSIPGTGIRYGLISFDQRGEERTDDADGRMSDVLVRIAASEPITNVFLHVPDDFDVVAWAAGR